MGVAYEFDFTRDRVMVRAWKKGSSSFLGGNVGDMMRILSCGTNGEKMPSGWLVVVD